MESLGDKVIKGAVWTSIERFGFLSIQFIANLIMARILMPSDFGIIGILLIFMNIANVLADSGLGAALIQRKSISSIDCNTIFYTNICVGFVLYFLLYICAPIIESFFNHDNLVSYLRIINIIILIDALSSIQNSLLVRSLNFKKIATIKIISALVACSISICLALRGYGVWSLVWQYVIYSISRSILLFFIAKWRPNIQYSFSSLKSLFGYGSKLMFSTFISDLYLNFQALLIGKFLTPKILGYYTQAKQLQQVPVTALTSIVNQVTFPALSKIQDDSARFAFAFKNNITLLAFVNFPLMFLLSAIATPLVSLLYTSKWLPAVPYLQFLCIGFGALLAIHNTNLTALKAIGKSGAVLKLEIIKKMIGCILLFVGIKIYGIWGLMGALSVCSVLELFLNGYYINKYLGIHIFKQIEWFGSFLLFSGLSFFCTLLVLNYMSINNIGLIAIGCCVFIIMYMTLIFLFKRKTFKNNIYPVFKRIGL